MTGSIVCARRIHEGKYMPANWVPTKHDVIIGRGKKVYYHEGNQKLRDLVKVEVDAYSRAQNRAAKSVIIIRIFDKMRQDTDIGFVKKDAATKQYYAVEDTAAKITIAQYFRDALADGYKSSKQYKQKLRDEMKRSVSDLGQNSEPMGSSLSSKTKAKALKRSASVGDGFRASPLDDDNYKEESPSNYMMKVARERCNPSSAFNIIKGGSELAEEMDDCPFPDIDTMNSTHKSDVSVGLSSKETFAYLFMAFGRTATSTCNPFEPTPIKESCYNFQPRSRSVFDDIFQEAV